MTKQNMATEALLDEEFNKEGTLSSFEDEEAEQGSVLYQASFLESETN